MSTLWATPVPSTAFVQGVSFNVLPGRICSLAFDYEDDHGTTRCELRFLDVASLKITYLPALTVEMIKSSYDRLIDVGPTAWLQEVEAVTMTRGDGQPRKHLRICFDDGPCYEFVCAHFEVRRGTSTG